MYNLLGDPACEMKLPQEMSLIVKPAEDDTLTVSGKTFTDCSEIFCESIKTREEMHSLNSRLSVKERQARFNEMNQRPAMLFKKSISGKSWRIQVRLPNGNVRNKSYLRCIAVGREDSYAGWSKMK